MNTQVLCGNFAAIVVFERTGDPNDDTRREQHVAGPPDDARQRVEEPDGDGAPNTMLE